MTLKFRTAANSDGLANMKSRLVACKLDGAMQVGWWGGWPKVSATAPRSEKQNVSSSSEMAGISEGSALRSPAIRMVRVHTHLCYDGSGDGIGFGSLEGTLGTIREPVNSIS